MLPFVNGAGACFAAESTTTDSGTTSLLGWAYVLLAGLLIPSPSTTRTGERRIDAGREKDGKRRVARGECRVEMALTGRERPAINGRPRQTSPVNGAEDRTRQGRFRLPQP